MFIDLRKLNKTELLELRRQVVRLKIEGCGGREIECLTGVRANRVSEIWRRYLKNGDDGLIPGKPGTKPGGRSLLTVSMECGIRWTMISNTPDNMCMPYSLWTRQIASDFIRRKYGVRLSLRCMTNYFKKWGFTCHMPLWQTAAIDSADFARFMNEVYPAIIRRAASENVGIYWYSEKPVSKEFPAYGDACRNRLTMTAAMTARGTARFMFTDRKIGQEEFITLVSRLIRYADRKVFFIAPDRREFCEKNVAAWLKGRENSIEVFYYPEPQCGLQTARD